jgi:hypothetical protein
MATYLVPIDVGDDTSATVLVEVEEVRPVNVPISRDGIAEKARQTFIAAIDQVKPAINAVASQLSDLAVKPEGMSVEFGIKLTATADALIAKTAVEGNLKVTMSWKC